MSKITINSYQELEQYVGKELGESDFITVSPGQINLFAGATHNNDWTHVDTERARNESLNKATIVQEYLILSLIPHLWIQIVEIKNTSLTMNYAIEELRFEQPVLANSELRLRASLISLKDLRGVAKAEINVTIEQKRNKNNVLNATLVFLYHFK